MSIKIEHLNYVYSEGTAYEKHALKDICLEIPHGEFVGIIGHTGSGKSTLIQHLNGLIKGTSGAIYYNGENIYQDGYDMRALRSQVGLVFQYPEHQLFEETVLKDVCFGPMNMGMSREEAEKKAGPEPLLKVTPWKLKTAGVITTGSEVYKGLIKDQFTPIVEKKLETFGIQMTKHVLCSDDTKMITDAIAEMKEAGVDLIICTGGMSVDPDDKTPGAIKASGAEIVTYGAPTLPGAMLCLAYFEDDTPIVGLPGCVMYAKATVFDLILPRMAAGIKIERRDIIRMGHGGLCLGCKECHYPVCPFGKEA